MEKIWNSLFGRLLFRKKGISERIVGYSGLKSCENLTERDQAHDNQRDVELICIRRVRFLLAYMG